MSGVLLVVPTFLAELFVGLVAGRRFFATLIAMLPGGVVIVRALRRSPCAIFADSRIHIRFRCS
jgi:hypothetical protein